MWDDTLEVIFIQDSSERVFNKASIFSDGGKIGPYDDIGYASLTVTDTYYGKLFKIIDNDTTVFYPMNSEVHRTAYFLKQYSDAYEYLGWVFWGYGGGDNHRLAYFSVEQGPSFSTVPTDTNLTKPRWYYTQEDNIPQLDPSDSISMTSATSFRVFAYDNTNKLTTINTIKIGSLRTTGWKIVTSFSKYNNLITVEGAIDTVFDTTFAQNNITVIKIDTSLSKSKDMIVPYKAAIF